MNKVYIVFKDSGSWDSHWVHVDKVFSNKNKADEYAKSINDKFAELKSNLPIDESYSEEFDMNKYDECMEKLVKEKDEFKLKYNISSYDVEEFNECTVVEFEIN